MFKFFKRSSPKLDNDELILITKAALKKIKELKTEIKILNLKNKFLIESLERQKKIIKMLESEKKSQLVGNENIPQN